MRGISWLAEWLSASQEELCSMELLYNVLRIKLHMYARTKTAYFSTNSMDQSPFWEANSHSSSQGIPCPLWHLKVCVHKSLPSLRPCVTFCNMLVFLQWEAVRPQPNPQAGGPPQVKCPWLLIQNYHCYPPYLEVLSSIHNLTTHQFMMT
jgi:hypothetical protein